MAQLLLDNGYIVHGLKRRSSSFNTGRIEQIYQDPHEQNPRSVLHYSDRWHQPDPNLQETQPDEIYNLAAQSHVAVSFETPEYTANADGVGTLRLLEAIRMLGLECKTNFYQGVHLRTLWLGAGGAAVGDEALLPALALCRGQVVCLLDRGDDREAYGMRASNGILFNHESPLRGETFVTRKITRAAAAIKLERQKKLWLGNLDAKRDWGHVREYVRGMWLMLQQDEPDDYVLVTGETTTVRTFVDWAFEDVGITLRWDGTGIEAKGYCVETGRCLVEIDRRYFRPTRVDLLIDDPTRAKDKLGWVHQTPVRNLVREMVEADLVVMRDAPLATDA